jgi:hypothetical protein
MEQLTVLAAKLCMLLLLLLLLLVCPPRFPADSCFAESNTVPGRSLWLQLLRSPLLLLLL